MAGVICDKRVKGKVYKQCRINNGANGAAARGPPQSGAPTKDFFFAH